MKNVGDKSYVLIIDDHPLMREGLAKLISQDSNLSICGEATSIQDSFDKCSVDEPDIAIVDLTFKKSSGFEQLKVLKDKFPSLDILVFSMHDEQVWAPKAIQSGARGYIAKNSTGEEIMNAIRTVLNGKIFLSQDVKDYILERLASGSIDQDIVTTDSLSSRELEIFKMIGQGFKPGEIAEHLGLSVKTIDTYRERIKAKFSLKSAGELTKKAIHWFRAYDAGEY